ncbi:hypothetical protein JOH52_007196 [Sinorhizobium meliloti]|nr:hypothetical protein [Sinorhizobium meliloti]
MLARDILDLMAELVNGLCSGRQSSECSSLVKNRRFELVDEISSR